MTNLLHERVMRVYNFHCKHAVAILSAKLVLPCSSEEFVWENSENSEMLFMLALSLSCLSLAPTSW